MYQALYRKWRPRTFADVSGQEHITETLRRQVESGRLSHAYLFVGTRGTGKTTCAKILSRAINCEHPVGGEPCNSCPTCLGIENGSILDVVELDAASNNSVDNVRKLQDEAIYSPAQTKKRVYIIDEMHMLSGSAANALLKIIEEPPEHLVFIFATTELHKVPATILSRCQRFSFKRLPQELIRDRLKYVASQEGIAITDQAAEMLARLADGALRDGLSLLDQCASGGSAVDEDRIISVVGLSRASETAKLFELILSGSTADALDMTDSLYANGRNMSSLLDELAALARDIMVYKLAKKSGEGLLSGAYDTATLKKLASVPTSRLMSISDTLMKGAEAFSATANRRLAAELCIIRLCDESLSSGDSAIISRIERLENTVLNGTAVSSVGDNVILSRIKALEDALQNGAVAIAVAAGDSSPAYEDDDEPAFDYPEPDEPENDFAPPVIPEPPVADDDRFWDRILAAVKTALDVPTFMMLCDKTDVDASLRGDTLIVEAKSTFTPNIIGTQAVLDALRAAAKDVLGRPVTVKVGAKEASAQDKLDKLDALSRFDNIEFK